MPVTDIDFSKQSGVSYSPGDSPGNDIENVDEKAKSGCLYSKAQAKAVPYGLPLPLPLPLPAPTLPQPLPLPLPPPLPVPLPLTLAAWMETADRVDRKCIHK